MTKDEADSERFVLKRTDGGRYESRRVEVALAELIVNSDMDRALVYRSILYGVPTSALQSHGITDDLINEAVGMLRRSAP